MAAITGALGRPPATAHIRRCASQFVAGTWPLWVLVVVGAAAYGAFEWSATIGWDGLLSVNHYVPLRRFIPPSGTIAIVVGFRAIVTVGVVLALRRLFLASKRPAMGFAAPTWKQVVFAVQVAAGMIGVNAVISYVLPRPSGPHAYPLTEWMAPHRGLVDYLNDLLTSSVATPIVEETLFRGLLFAGLVQWVPPWLAACFSGLVFALWHEDPAGILTLTASGIFLAYAYYRSGTLWVSIIAHGLNNWLVVSVMLALNGHSR